jgi:hypothetical protein
MSKRLIAYGKLAHHALSELYSSEDGCCPECCAPCDALLILDREGVLDSVVQLWAEYDDGTPVLPDDPEKAPSWWKDGKVDRQWLYTQWSIGEVGCEHKPLTDMSRQEDLDD